MAEEHTSSDNNGFILPPSIDQLIDKSKFDETITCLAVRCDRKHTQPVITHFRAKLFGSPEFSNIAALRKIDDVPEPYSILILRYGLKHDDISEENKKFLDSISATITEVSLDITLEQRSLDWLLAHYLPHIPNVITSFETVGHIAHMNLRGDIMLEAKYVIGALILEKNREDGIRTVVNKVGAVDNEFRVLPMELLAGDCDTLVSVLEGGCTFHFDFKDVFWNSRLQLEHTRIVQMMKPADIVCDMFAGVGPFAVPLARRAVQVYANDLNPKSFEWMEFNAKKNLGKAKISKLSCYCMDARDFAKFVFQQQAIKATHVLMNLPKLAPEFCDVFVKLLPKGHTPLPRIHVYCFGTGDTPEIMQERALTRIETALGGYKLSAKENDLNVFKVRQTATFTLEFCISFILPAEIAYMD